MKVFEFKVKVSSVEWRRNSFSVSAESEKEAREKLDKIMEENSEEILDAKFDIEENDTEFILEKSTTQPAIESHEVDCMNCEKTFQTVKDTDFCEDCQSQFKQATDLIKNNKIDN